MRELIPNRLVDLIFKLNLPMRLIANGKKAYPFIIKSRDIKGNYTIMSTLKLDELRQTKNWEIEMKGRIDVESVKYRGTVNLIPSKDEMDCYIMNDIKLYKENLRGYKRVPYRRAIQIISPIEEDAVLVNLSASGAMIYSINEITEQPLKFKFILAKKPLELEADIIEQKFDEALNVYVIRCHFSSISDKEMKHINRVVKEIIIQAKERLNGGEQKGAAKK